MASTIKLKNGSGAPTAGDLVQGEPALDLTNKRLYTENASGTVIEVGTNPTSLTTGTFTSTGIDDNATSTAITIDSNENVGIGTSSPTRPLTVNGNNGTGMIINDAANDKALRFRATGDAFYIEATNNAESAYANIALAGNVGIGTSSPAYKLDLNGDMRFTSGSAMFWADTNVYEGRTGNDRYWVTGGSERARIDSSGNLLVGKTATSFGTAGVVLRGDSAEGLIQATRANNECIEVNRTGSDGAIAIFAKDGTTVGSIGSISGDMYIGTGDTGLRFHDSNNVVYPANQGAVVDATLDIGDVNYRWKDLYLSGGVYLGGTGAANKLDDYEEGTWTPAFSGTTTNPSVTYIVSVGNYTKVGRLVSVSWRLQISAISGGSGLAQITGLPFAQAAAAGNAHVQISALTNMSGPASKNGGFVEPSTSFIYLCDDNGLTFSPSSLGTGIFFGTATYFTA